MIELKKRKPIIGITPQIGKLEGMVENEQMIRLFPQYMEALLDEGAVPVMLPFIRDPQDLIELVDAMDGFLFTGGIDVGRALYVPDADASERNCRDKFEVPLLAEIIRQDKPLMGICRGLQIINVAMGGTLVQDLPGTPEEHTGHDRVQELDKIVHHRLNVVKGSLLERICACSSMGVNSYHHQAIAELGDNLEVQGVSEDGIIEAIRLTNMTYGIAVQWHPELVFNQDVNARRLFRSFVRATIIG